MTVSETTPLLDYLRAVRQRWRLVALVVVVTTGVALGFSLSSEKQYDAVAELLLRGQEPVNTLLDPNSGGGSNDPERELNTQVELVKVSSNAFAVLRELRLARTADDLLAQVETETSSTSNIVALRVRDRDPLLAAKIANAFATTYVQFRLDTARRRYREAADLAQRQLLELSPVDRRTAEGRELQARQRELQITAALQTGGVEIVRRASVPTSPSRPRPKLSAAVGLLLGLLIGVGAALLLNLVDRRFKDEREIEEFFDLPVLAGIPRPARRGSERDDAAQREAYGMLASNLRASTIGPALSVLMVTSPGPGDGKTSVTLGVARAYAQLGLTVIMIEADLRRPSFGRFTDVTTSGGLTSALGGSAVAHELIWLDANSLQVTGQAAGDRGFIGVLPAGALPDNPQRALSDPAMTLVVEEARDLADIVLIDTAPVGTVNDATMLRQVAEGVVIAARLNHTTKDAARRANRTLRNLGVEMLGVVVTDAGAGARHSYYAAMPATPAPTTSVEPAHERTRSGARGGPD